MSLVETIALIPTTVLLLAIVSQYFLFLLPQRRRNLGRKFCPSISIIVPAHNEGKHIENTLNSIISARYLGKKEIIVVNDGSTDNTQEIIENFEKRKLIKGIKTKHLGKASALNKALRSAANEITILVDGDTDIARDSLRNIVRPFLEKEVGAVVGVTQVRKSTPLTWFQNIEYAFYSLTHKLNEKIDAILFVPGNLGAYRTKMLKNFGGFSTNNLVEDCEIAFKTHQSGYKIVVAEDSTCFAEVPNSIGRLVRQRLRWSRGVIQTLKTKSTSFLNTKNPGIGFYSMPLLSYWFLHAAIIVPIIFYQILFGYYQNFVVYSNIISLDALKYFFYWFSFFGIINLINMILNRTITLTPLLFLNILITFLGYGLYLFSLYRFYRKITLRDVLALIFFFPYIVMILILQIFGISELFRSTKKFKWEK